MRFLKIVKNFLFDFLKSGNFLKINHRRRQGEDRDLPGMEKNCRKIVLFPKALFLAITFQKILKNSIFILNF